MVALAGSRSHRQPHWQHHRPRGPLRSRTDGPTGLPAADAELVGIQRERCIFHRARNCVIRPHPSSRLVVSRLLSRSPDGGAAWRARLASDPGQVLSEHREQQDQERQGAGTAADGSGPGKTAVRSTRTRLRTDGARGGGNWVPRRSGTTTTAYLGDTGRRITLGMHGPYLPGAANEGGETCSRTVRRMGADPRGAVLSDEWEVCGETGRDEEVDSLSGRWGSWCAREDSNPRPAD